jgi:hypothetical protein
MNRSETCIYEIFKTSTEGFNKKYEKNAYSIEFTVEDQHYLLEALQMHESPGEWVVSFSLLQYSQRSKRLHYRSDVTGTGQVFKVFGVVVHLLENFIHEVHPKRLSFSANSNEPSRVRLYDRLTHMFARKYRYRLETSFNTLGSKVYTLQLD